ncbi:MAG: hypothetical protein EXR86_03785 [Gammaproteobacteria bacterium]|nr:hypothetical protein [Gammaproteobacteria bacterium]
MMTLRFGLKTDMRDGKSDGTYWVESTGDTVFETAGAGFDSTRSAISLRLPSHVEVLILEGKLVLNGTGNSGNNTLTGNAGVNKLISAAGDDVLNGDRGSDRLEGGRGDDTLIVDTSRDVVVERANEGTDTVRSTFSYRLTSNLENLELRGTKNLTGTGNGLENVVTGNGGRGR